MAILSKIYDIYLPLAKLYIVISLSIKNMSFINVLNKLNTNKSPGPDNIHPKLLKETRYEIALPLKIIFEKTLTSGNLPKKLNGVHIHRIQKYFSS